MSANFTPVIGDYKQVGPFHFWCQKVLPAVYDDSLSYYELLCKVVASLNDVITNTNQNTTDLRKLYEAYTLLQDWVNHYFDNLDIQTEVNARLDQLLSDGELSELVGVALERYLVVVNEAIERQDKKIDDAINAQNTKIDNNNALVVNVTEFNNFDMSGKTDKGVEEILAAVNANRPVYLHLDQRDESERFNLQWCSSQSAVFCHYSPSDKVFETFMLDLSEDNSFRFYQE